MANQSNVKEILLRVLKIFLLVIGLVSFVGFITHFILGIRDSVTGDDIITAQDRVNGAYQFIRMAGCGLITLAAVLPTVAIKVNIIPEKIKNLFHKKEKIKESHQE